MLPQPYRQGRRLPLAHARTCRHLCSASTEESRTRHARHHPRRKRDESRVSWTRSSAEHTRTHVTRPSSATVPARCRVDKPHASTTLLQTAPASCARSYKPRRPDEYTVDEVCSPGKVGPIFGIWLPTGTALVKGSDGGHTSNAAIIQRTVWCHKGTTVPTLQRPTAPAQLAVHRTKGRGHRYVAVGRREHTHQPREPSLACTSAGATASLLACCTAGGPSTFGPLWSAGSLARATHPRRSTTRLPAPQGGTQHTAHGEAESAARLGGLQATSTS